MSEEELADVMELDAVATPGPWYVHFTDDEAAAGAVYVSTQPPDEHFDEGRGLAAGWPEQVAPAHVVAITLLQNPSLANVGDERWDENARFIAAARTYLPQLAAEVIRLRAELSARR